jgi:hypothetical protein
MELNDLRYGVQHIKGTPESVLKAINLLVSEYSSDSNRYIPKTIEYGFFEEFSKIIIEWIGKGDEKALQQSFNAIREVIRSDDEFVSPFAGTSSKRRFGAQLQMMSDFIETYLRSDLHIKDHQRIMGSGRKEKRLRILLTELFKIEGTFEPEMLSSKDIYESVSRKTIERDLNDLTDWLLVRKIRLSAKKICYELTAKAYYLKDKVEEKLRAEIDGNDGDGVEIYGLPPSYDLKELTSTQSFLKSKQLTPEPSIA